MARPLHLQAVLLVFAIREEFEYLQEALVQAPTQVTDAPVELYSIMLPDRQLEGIGCFALIVDAMGIEAASRTTTTALEFRRFDAVVNIGIAGALASGLSIADVVVSSESHHFLLAARSREDAEGNEEFQFAGNTAQSDKEFAETASQLQDAYPDVWQALTTQWATDLARIGFAKDGKGLLRKGLVKPVPGIRVGPTACGDYVVGSESQRRKILERNRKFLSIDMESYGVLNAAKSHHTRPRSISVRGISDAANRSKADTDAFRGGLLRRLATLRALRTAIGILRADGQVRPRSQQADLSTNLAIASRNALDQTSLSFLPHHLKVPPDPSLKRTYASLFEIITVSRGLARAHSLTDEAAAHITASPTASPLEVDGQAGTGKTTLLGLIYWKLRELAGGDSSIYPVYVNLHCLNEMLHQVAPPDPHTRRDQISKLFHPLQKFMESNPATSLILIVDGLDYAALHGNEAELIIDHMVKGHAHRKVAGIRSVSSAAGDSTKSVSGKAWITTTGAHGGQKAKSLIEAFTAIVAPEHATTSAQALTEFAKGIELPDFDLFSLSIMQARLGRDTFPDGYGALRDLLEWYSRETLAASDASATTTVEQRLDAASEFAFQQEIRGQRGTSIDPAIWRLVNKHARVADFLAARRIVNRLLLVGRRGQIGAEELGQINYVFPFRINRLCKSLVNADRPSQALCFEAIRAILGHKSGYYYAKAHAAYIAGRLTDDQLALQSQRELRKALGPSGKKAKRPDQPEMLFRRTVLVSLANLGDKAAAREYLELLLTDKMWDEINRGFHLEYYGDQPFVPGRPLRSTDNLGPSPQTFEQLLVRVESTVPSPLYEVELHTLCSLAQHRHASRRLTTELRVRVRGALTQVAKRGGLLPELRVFVGMVQHHLEDDRFSPVKPLLNLLSVKTVQRAGWLKRGKKDGESVAEHMYGAYLLGVLLLPERTRSREYNKKRILEMLAIHDLAEAIVGDVIPEDRNDRHIKAEEAAFEEIRLLGTYDSFAPTSDLHKLWQEFEARTTENARIARDIDKLENLVQLFVYRDGGWQPPDFERWRDELEQSIKTDVVSSIVTTLFHPTANGLDWNWNGE